MDTLGLVLRVFVTTASVGVLGSVQEACRVLKRIKQMGNDVSRLHTIWVDAGFDGEPFMQWVMNVCR